MFVAWLLDIRNAKIMAIENKRKTEAIMNQFIQIYRRMLWVRRSVKLHIAIGGGRRPLMR